LEGWSGGRNGLGGRNGFGGRKGKGGRKGNGGRLGKGGKGGRKGIGGRNGIGGKNVSIVAEFLCDGDDRFGTLCFWLQNPRFSIGLNESKPVENMFSPCFSIMRSNAEVVEIEGILQYEMLLLMSLTVHSLIFFACFHTLNGSFTLNSPCLSVSTSFLKIGKYGTLHSTPTLAPAHDKTKHYSKRQIALQETKYDKVCETESCHQGNQNEPEMKGVLGVISCWEHVSQ